MSDTDKLFITNAPEDILATDKLSAISVYWIDKSPLIKTFAPVDNVFLIVVEPKTDKFSEIKDVPLIDKSFLP